MIAVARGATHASHEWLWMATLGLRAAGTAQRNAHIEQISTIISRAWWTPCKRNDRGKMPMWGGRSRRIITRTGS
jgi:hypothetical protein